MPTATTPAFRNPEGHLYHGGALAYALLAYAFGIAGLFSASGLVNAFSTLLLAHGMAIAAYMIHECGHNTVFRQNTDNAKLGKFLTWMCGAAYGTYEDIRYKHFRHHVDVDDVVWFDYENYFREHPGTLRVIQVLEWFYIPAHDLLMHVIMVFTSFVIPERRDQRARNVRVILTRGSIFFAVLIFYPKSALLYTVAYMMMMTILRFMDSLQHDYGYHLTLFTKETPPRKGDYEFEQEHSFSNPHSFSHESLNWFTLNFGFHNAHHAKPITPWWKLPEVHRELFGTDPGIVIPLWPQLKIFHKYRVTRITGGSADRDEAEAWGRSFLLAAQEARVTGGNAASFLTSF
jgi:fatty acid desaturase